MSYLRRRPGCWTLGVPFTAMCNSCTLLLKYLIKIQKKAHRCIQNPLPPQLQTVHSRRTISTLATGRDAGHARGLPKNKEINGGRGIEQWSRGSVCHAESVMGAKRLGCLSCGPPTSQISLVLLHQAFCPCVKAGYSLTSPPSLQRETSFHAAYVTGDYYHPEEQSLKESTAHFQTKSPNIQIQIISELEIIKNMIQDFICCLGCQVRCEVLSVHVNNLASMHPGETFTV